jgi:hypothetical protein
VSHEVTEHIEHAAHDHGPQANLSRMIGITIAILGVLMALCSAQLGAARTELIATMVEENGAAQRYQSVSGKYRTLQAQLQQLHALMPDPKFKAKTDSELKTVKTQVKNPDVTLAINANGLETQKILNTVTPTRGDVVRFMKLVRRHRAEAEAAREWSESYEDAINVHANTASRFEIALIAAEIAIVIASVGLLLHKQVWFARGAWLAAAILGLLSLSIGGLTFVANQNKLHGAEEKIAASHRHFTDMCKEDEDVAEDEKLMDDMEKNLESLPSGS